MGGSIRRAEGGRGLWKAGRLHSTQHPASPSPQAKYTCCPCLPLLSSAGGSQAHPKLTIQESWQPDDTQASHNRGDASMPWRRLVRCHLNNLAVRKAAAPTLPQPCSAAHQLWPSTSSLL